MDTSVIEPEPPTAQMDDCDSIQHICPLTGTVPNIHWQAIPMEALRCHPLYQPLPEASDVVLSDTKDLCRYRQDSWQWEALHQGRLTTSKLAAVLGFFEHEVAEVLGIPRSLRGHNRVVEAWQTLRTKPPASWAHLQTPSSSALRTAPQSLWTAPSPDGDGFPYQYHPPDRRPNGVSRRLTDPLDIRLAWGTAQEPTAILTAVNYLALHQPTAHVQEAGMCVFEALDPQCVHADIRKWVDEGSLPLLGASPDGLIAHLDGTMQVLEVKCFSPFQQVHGQLQVSFARPHHELAVWHVPQLQYEMLCAGPQCTSALLIVLFVDGAHIYRIDRDEEYQTTMLGLVREFFLKFIKNVKSNRMKPPPPNFFTPRALGTFLQHTKRIATAAQLVAVLPNAAVQRSSTDCQYFWS